MMAIIWWTFHFFNRITHKFHNSIQYIFYTLCIWHILAQDSIRSMFTTQSSDLSGNDNSKMWEFIPLNLKCSLASEPHIPFNSTTDICFIFNGQINNIFEIRNKWEWHALEWKQIQFSGIPKIDIIFRISFSAFSFTHRLSRGLTNQFSHSLKNENGLTPS